ncbi:hypothetical protein UFOVP225_24 [uncultured Caudovirales phage]|uniref:Uncharacterized protein n=1 Tax=uncultured Caudovirales phage TaxID=2100421 RepID=A0A6J5L5A3_9CAUD|nr:hypothetical protein UFOVP113_37 [uncultured Caudovirales phage]CAB5219100.1 hypothetical protein UFOVP225_24 [uncultured Caudovirales phage]
MRAHTPGGRFDADFESDRISEGITEDLANPVGNSAEWWKFDSVNSQMDPVYDVERPGTGRIWTGPTTLRVIRSSITEGSNPLNARGFYNTDTLHLTVNIDDLYDISSELFSDRSKVKPALDLANKYRVVWKGQVYRPIKTQPAGLVANRHTLIVIDLMQLAPDELVNDTQFLSYAQP